MGEWLIAFESEFARHYDTPDEFLVGIGYAVAGAAFANRIFLRSPDEISTNLYLILTSPPGWFHKSSPLRAGLRVLRRVVHKDTFLSSNASAEAMAKQILNVCTGDLGHAILTYDEFRSFLTHVRREYATTIATLVTEKFERGIPVEFARRSRDGENGVEKDVIPEGFILSFVASTTTPWLVEGLKESDVTGGMLSRFLLVSAESKTRHYELPAPVDEDKLASLGSTLRMIVDEVVPPGTRAEFSFSDPARKLYAEIYRDIERRAQAHGNPDFPSLISRMPAYVKKMALVHAGLSRRADRVIRTDDVEGAAELVFRSIRTYESIIDEALASDNAYGKTLLRVRKVLSSIGRIGKREMLKLAHLRMRDLDEILESLERQGRITIERSDKDEVLVWKG